MDSCQVSSKKYIFIVTDNYSLLFNEFFELTMNLLGLKHDAD